MPYNRDSLADWVPLSPFPDLRPGAQEWYDPEDDARDRELAEEFARLIELNAELDEKLEELEGRVRRNGETLDKMLSPNRKIMLRIVRERLIIALEKSFRHGLSETPPNTATATNTASPPDPDIIDLLSFHTRRANPSHLRSLILHAASPPTSPFHGLSPDGLDFIVAPTLQGFVSSIITPDHQLCVIRERDRHTVCKEELPMLRWGIERLDFWDERERSGARNVFGVVWRSLDYFLC
ncbi:hypothetical protein CPB83DRAFT_865155 [Crepidotus variabilis]|uniref:Uncharacterized protein n=1 Tax=Crepidotus variabilis TaxID=179855 RepID=A0A9P6E3N3_9AGAR|nr:hypothetical protein CPB83DRAFT_865155 [Crepidotus variabilis]